MPDFSMPTCMPPLPRTYWVVDKFFLAGAYAGQEDPNAHRERLEGLWNAGMRTFISLMEENEKNNSGHSFNPYAKDLESIASKHSDQVNCLRFPIVDRSVTTIEHMSRILDAIDHSIERQRAVYLHCFGGIGRTGTTVCCWLLRHGYATKSNVFELLSSLRKADCERSWREAPENQSQRDFVLRFLDGTKSSVSVPKPNLPVALERGDDWFSRLTGFAERSPVNVRELVSVKDCQLTSHVNHETYQCGRLEIASLGDLRKRTSSLLGGGCKIQVSEVVGDAKSLHAHRENAQCVFQVASQFNLLEMVSPNVTPEHGITIYENDPTQGPACAIACGAGTIYRNYLVELDGQQGQSKQKQIDCLADIGMALGNQDNKLWTMQNGYAMPSLAGLQSITNELLEMSEREKESLRDKLRVGIQWDTQVTNPRCLQLVTQVYCSAMPVAYTGLPSKLWEPFAKLILDAAYEATFSVAVLNRARTGRNSLFLTLLGGGAFGNQSAWILDAIDRNCKRFADEDLQIKIVSYQTSNPAVRGLAQKWS